MVKFLISTDLSIICVMICVNPATNTEFLDRTGVIDFILDLFKLKSIRDEEIRIINWFSNALKRSTDDRSRRAGVFSVTRRSTCFDLYKPFFVLILIFW